MGEGFEKYGVRETIFYKIIKRKNPKETSEEPGVLTGCNKQDMEAGGSGAQVQVARQMPTRGQVQWGEAAGKLPRPQD